ncbi:MAG: 23S rRNA (uracil(1939)-C(5))-methyltransferase RlmD, partial [Deltaproteobacteria bacterium]|nr:23S rRNA (uracil(1939)-C(5))-methyltransferase RlmD [Deltaproteobacteria bacterium]
LFLADRALHVHGFEQCREAVACARSNAKRNKLHNCSFTAGDVAVQAKRAARAGESPDIVIADPPRAGIDPKLIALLLELRAKILVAVSCDPARLARDLARLSEGYQVQHVQPFDFFPRTPHVESVALLVRRG